MTASIVTHHHMNVNDDTQPVPKHHPKKGSEVRKLIVSFHSTANNIVTGSPHGDETDFVAWAQPGVDESSEKFLTWLHDVDTMILGRGTYDDLVRKWPVVDQWPDVPAVALQMGEIINSSHKYVVTSESPRNRFAWGRFEPAQPISGVDLHSRIGELKAHDGGEIITFGSPTLVRSLLNARLVDEYRILVHPVIMHEGRRIFDDLDHRTDLRVLDIDPLPSGTLMVRYAPADPS